jgi:uncharacterized protein YjdB
VIENCGSQSNAVCCVAVINPSRLVRVRESIVIMSNHAKVICVVLKRLNFIAVSLFILFLLACGAPPITSSGVPHMTSLVIITQTSSIALGQTTQLKAMGMYSDGSSKDLTQSAVWTTANPEVASVDSSGLVASVAVGSVSVTAANGGHHGSLVLTVSKAALVSLTVSPSGSSVALGNTIQLAATGTYSDKSTQDLTGGVNWASSQPGVAVVSSSGLAASRSVGTSSRLLLDR